MQGSTRQALSAQFERRLDTEVNITGRKLSLSHVHAAARLINRRTGMVFETLPIVQRELAGGGGGGEDKKQIGRECYPPTTKTAVRYIICTS